MRLQALAAAAQFHRARFSAQKTGVDPLTARAAEEKLAAERRDRQAALATPRERRKRLLGFPGRNHDLAAIGPQRRAVVLDERSRAARGQLLQHLDELRLARCPQAPGGKKASQQM